MNPHGFWSLKLLRRHLDATNGNKRNLIMTKIIPIDQPEREHWKQQNAKVLEEVQDQALKEMIKMVLNLHELEHNR